MVTVFEIDFGEPLGAYCAILEFVHKRKWVSVRDRDAINPLVVDAKTQSSALRLWYEEDRCAGGGGRASYFPHAQYVLDPFSVTAGCRLRFRFTWSVSSAVLRCLGGLYEAERPPMAGASPVTSPRLIGSLWFGSDMGSLESLSYAERQARRSVFGLTVRAQDVYGRKQYIQLERQKVE